MARRRREELRDYAGNPLSDGAKIGLAVLGLGVVGGGILIAAKVAQANAAPSSGSSSSSSTTNPLTTIATGITVVSTLSAGSTYSGSVSSSSDPTTAVVAAYPGAQVSQLTPGIWSVSFVWSGTDGASPPAISGATWISLQPSVTGL